VIRNNLCLRGGIKNREGFGRVVENNILVDGGYDPHVWYADSGDAFRRNLVWTAYRPATCRRLRGARRWFNLMHRDGATGRPGLELRQQQSGRDEHSIVADAQFIDPARGDYRVKDSSPALALGFVNFPMDRFGVQKPELKAIARTPELPRIEESAPRELTRATDPVTWLGASVRNITSVGEMSAFGLPGVTGVLVLEVPAGLPLAKAGLRQNDVILSVNGAKTTDTASIVAPNPGMARCGPLKIGLPRPEEYRSHFMTMMPNRITLSLLVLGCSLQQCRRNPISATAAHRGGPFKPLGFATNYQGAGMVSRREVRHLGALGAAMPAGARRLVCAWHV
jgi:hypothetical protein